MRRDLPVGLTERVQWVCWREQERDGRQATVPVDPNRGGFGSATNHETWSEFEDTRGYAESDGFGIGFVFTESDPLVGVDLDHVLQETPDAGRMTQAALPDAADVTPVTLRAPWYELRELSRS